MHAIYGGGFRCAVIADERPGAADERSKIAASI
jgi:hypothetical protein